MWHYSSRGKSGTKFITVPTKPWPMLQLAYFVDMFSL